MSSTLRLRERQLEAVLQGEVYLLSVFMRTPRVVDTNVLDYGRLTREWKRHKHVQDTIGAVKVFRNLLFLQVTVRTTLDIRARWQ